MDGPDTAVDEISGMNWRVWTAISTVWGEVVEEVVDVCDEPRFEEIARRVPVEIRRAVSFRPMREI